MGEFVRPAVPRAGGPLSADCRPTPPPPTAAAHARAVSRSRSLVENASQYIRSAVGTEPTLEEEQLKAQVAVSLPVVWNPMSAIADDVVGGVSYTGVVYHTEACSV